MCALEDSEIDYNIKENSWKLKHIEAGKVDFVYHRYIYVYNKLFIAYGVHAIYAVPCKYSQGQKRISTNIYKHLW